MIAHMSNAVLYLKGETLRGGKGHRSDTMNEVARHTPSSETGGIDTERDKPLCEKNDSHRRRSRQKAPESGVRLACLRDTRSLEGVLQEREKVLEHRMGKAPGVLIKREK